MPAGPGAASTAVLELLAGWIAGLHPGRRTRIAVDGVDGAGKSVLGAALAAGVSARGRPCVSATVDRFHRPAAERRSQERDSPIGYYQDSFDHAQLQRVLLQPFGPGGDGRYRRGVFDLDADAPDLAPVEVAAPDAVLVLDGVFLQRPELRDTWDVVVFLDVPFAVTYARMAVRDGCSPDPGDPANARYRQGQQLYLDRCRPAERADVLIDNTDPAAPRLLRRPQCWG